MKLIEKGKASQIDLNIIHILQTHYPSRKIKPFRRRIRRKGKDQLPSKETVQPEKKKYIKRVDITSSKGKYSSRNYKKIRFINEFPDIDVKHEQEEKEKKDHNSTRKQLLSHVENKSVISENYGQHSILEHNGMEKNKKRSQTQWEHCFQREASSPTLTTPIFKDYMVDDDQTIVSEKHGTSSWISNKSLSARN